MCCGTMPTPQQLPRRLADRRLFGPMIAPMQGRAVGRFEFGVGDVVTVAEVGGLLHRRLGLRGRRVLENP